MVELLISILSLVVPLSANLGSENLGCAQSPTRLEGAYVFVSESTSTTLPKKSAAVRSAPEWTGIYTFVGGTYTRSQADSARNKDWIGFFPKDYTGLGYESEAGSYTVKDCYLVLNAKVALHPMDYHRSTLYRFVLVGDQLILSQDLVPHTEDIREGVLEIRLRRVDQKALHDL